MAGARGAPGDRASIEEPRAGIVEVMQRHVEEGGVDIHALAAEYDKREIRVELEGYAIIPEAKTYFANLPITDDLLTRVTTLHQSSGMDGGPRHMDHLFPFWDPGAGDGPVPVTAKAVADLDLLPNLTRISGLENSKPNRTLLAALKARGIALLHEGQKQD